jgi:N utilization substance protein B
LEGNPERDFTTIENMGKRIIKRTEEREFAFKMLYASEFNQDPFDVQVDRLDVTSQEKATEYVRNIIKLYTTLKEEFDEIIGEKLENWDLDRVAIVDKVILRMAIAEIFHFEDIPPEVSINEAIELAKKYSTAGSGKFVNGLLDAIYRKHKQKKRMKNNNKEGISAD